MAKPPYFNVDTVMAGLHQAMLFGAPVDPEMRATFYIRPAADPNVPVDDEGVPLASTPAPRPPHTAKRVDCAVDFQDGTQVGENMGLIQAARVVLTLLGPDYDQVKGFEYVVIAGQRYNYRMTEPAVALGNIDIWTVHCQSEDEL